MTTATAAAILRGDDLARATLSYISRHPEEWDQESSFNCFIGHAIRLSGASLDSDMVVQGARLLGWTREETLAVFYNFTRRYFRLHMQVRQIRHRARNRAVQAGNIGKKVREVELDPGIFEPAPAEEPLAVPAEPGPVPESEPEPVPA